jgi:DNA topoisomerase-1
MEFGKRLPRIRRKVNRDLRQRHPTKTLVLAVLIRLLESSCIRVGNEEYAKSNGSFGLTTLRDRHVKVRGSNLRIEFLGKSGQRHCITLSDSRLARLVARCQEIPGQELFQYLDEHGRRHKIKSNDVNQYLREISGGDFTAKDFRTWVGTVLMARTLRAFEAGHSIGHARRVVKEALQTVAAHLGNTPAICQKSYVHPAVIDSFLAGVQRRGSSRGSNSKGRAKKVDEETELLRLLAAAPVQLSLENSLRRAIKHAVARRTREARAEAA